MDYVQGLYYVAKDYWFLTMLVGLVTCFIESFLPILPLIAIVGANALLLGLFGGLVLSWIGSGLGTLLLFIIVSKFSDNKFFNKLRNEKTEKAIKWMDRQGFKLLFFAYSCPFIPSFLVTVTSAFCKRELINFAPAMLAGKFVMFLVVSYPASDIKGFISSPTKIGLFLLLVFLSWKIGSKVNASLQENHKDDEKHYNDLVE
ncbi:TVP38/TMEM64 family protein [Romboutsia lituseburensis]|uniref:TVP38/TMEM64 family protein n=1 Tax=Romboutsia lituseburensis TaxID=1537 RepID=UPI00215A5F36|nr:VTT domain-containing protein [Romboutsia lituseburensis]MCR8744962.1 VTT domain-containing protein [Romboutsia lituseburensis]